MFTAACTLTQHKDTYPFIAPERFKGSLNNEVAVVTGAGRGIGRAIVLALAAAGASVCAIARNKEEVDTVVAEIKSSYGTPGMSIAADVSDKSAASKIVSEVENTLGPVSILINNAGVTRYNPFELEDPIDDWWRVMEVNLLGPVSLTRAVLPGMLERKHGTILSTSSTSGSLDIPFNTAYATSKAAIIKFHQDLDVEVRDRGIRNFTVHPGSVQTGLSQSEGAVNQAVMQRYPAMAEGFTAFQDYVFETPELAANTFVALCAEPRTNVLSGKYIDSQFDLEGVVQEVEKGAGNAVEERKLYRLKLEEL